MTITSTAFADQGVIPVIYTCQGEDRSPPLDIRNTPAGTKTLALIMDDPDTPMGTWTHWIMWNIPPTINIPEGHTPDGAVEGKGSRKTGYQGPCPPSGTHRYRFHVYALDTQLSIPAGSDRTVLEQAIDGHILDDATLTGLYAKQGS